MLNIYEKKRGDFSDGVKVRFLFRRVYHTGLHSSIDALIAKKRTGMTIYYTISANQFSTKTSELPEYIAKNARNISGVQVGDGAKGGDGIYNEYESINTGHIPSKKLLPFKDQKLVIDKRKRLGIIKKGKVVQNLGDVVIQTTKYIILIFQSIKRK